ncbi:methyltransferase [Marmoricola endophyticus]|uniref:Methyltransferase n=1 Tax=Marmoricola endophyticus TaxID=2040280 RepID=A0A917BAZ0_9ACTN|nr:bifunctional NAD(P)/FAD-dependent oxidoreductase/class I SAM-dependent methyltransferase [Marmoricola endophyticus]GGF34130.1 methyltransferase [Marmoricola endophyticus]
MTDHPEHRTIERHCDVAVIGGSAAGLAGALQLARQRRTVVVVDDGTARNAPAAHMHGYLGREGAEPAELRAVGAEEVRSYGGEVLTGRVLDVSGEKGAFRLALSGGHTLVARRILAATGIQDELPDIPGLAEHWGREVIHCPFCHGYEVRDQAVVQVLTHPMGLHPTPLLRHLTDRLTLVLHDAAGVDDQALDALRAGGVEVVADSVTRVTEAAPAGGVSLELGGGRTLTADAVLVGPRFRARTDVLEGIGVTAVPHASGLGSVVEVDPVGLTSVAGVYAAGNLTDPSMQVLPAAAHGSRVGAGVAFSLAEEDLAAESGAGGARADWEARYGGDDHVWSANPNGTLVAEASDLPVGRALDVGAGEGADALWLAERGWAVTAFDISASALVRVGAEADRRGLRVERVRGDANDLAPFGAEGFDLVSLQYGSFQRTPDERGLGNLLAGVAPGGTLLVVAHDLTPLQAPVDAATETRMFDHGAFVGVDRIHQAIAESADWRVETYETRDRPPGAASSHHVSDVLLRAVRLA